VEHSRFIYTAIFAPPVPWAQDQWASFLTLTAGAVMLGVAISYWIWFGRR
jgi:hypothetical protein